MNLDNYEDNESLTCINCGHSWILVSNKKITQEQHELWVNKFWEQHAKIHKEKGLN